jgi:hypothetical protein
MPNRLDPFKKNEVISLLEGGYPYRWITHKTGVAKATIAQLRRGIDHDIFCPCGVERRHQGWCKFRIMLYPHRLEIIRNLGLKWGGKCRIANPANSTKEHKRKMRLDWYHRTKEDRAYKKWEYRQETVLFACAEFVGDIGGIMDGHSVYCELLADNKIANNTGGPPIAVIAPFNKQKCFIYDGGKRIKNTVRKISAKEVKLIQKEFGDERDRDIDG